MEVKNYFLQLNCWVNSFYFHFIHFFLLDSLSLLSLQRTSLFQRKKCTLENCTFCYRFFFCKGSLSAVFKRTCLLPAFLFFLPFFSNLLDFELNSWKWHSWQSHSLENLLLIMTTSETIFLDETPIRCGLSPDTPSLTKEDLMKKVMLFTQEHFPCENIFTPSGVSKDQLLLGVRCISMAIRHDTAYRWEKRAFRMCGW